MTILTLHQNVIYFHSKIYFLIYFASGTRSFIYQLNYKQSQREVTISLKYPTTFNILKKLLCLAIFPPTAIHIKKKTKKIVTTIWTAVLISFFHLQNVNDILSLRKKNIFFLKVLFTGKSFLPTYWPPPQQGATTFFRISFHSISFNVNSVVSFNSLHWNETDDILFFVQPASVWMFCWPFLMDVVVAVAAPIVCVSFLYSFQLLLVPLRFYFWKMLLIFLEERISLKILLSHLNTSTHTLACTHTPNWKQLWSSDSWKSLPLTSVTLGYLISSA